MAVYSNEPPQINSARNPQPVTGHLVQLFPERLASYSPSLTLNVPLVFDAQCEGNREYTKSHTKQKSFRCPTNERTEQRRIRR